MIVDIHTHLSTLGQWGRAAGEAYGSEDSGHSNVDLHVTPARHLAAMEKADRAIVFGINSIALQMHTPNDQIAEYTKVHSAKMIGFMSIDPNDPGALEELERCVEDLGLRGIKMSPAFQCFHPQCENARRVHRRAEQLGLPILTHAAMQSISETPMEWANPILYDAVAREFPNLKIVLAHIGIPWFWDALEIGRAHV